jgi:hypothetical protein
VGGAMGPMTGWHDGLGQDGVFVFAHRSKFVVH